MTAENDAFLLARKAIELARDCSCPKCVMACKLEPGWFLPGEPGKAADLLGMPFVDFRTMLIEDYWDGPKPIFVLRPRKIIVEDGLERAASFPPEGRCIFLTRNDRCAIHEAKPFECRITRSCRPNGGVGFVIRRLVARITKISKSKELDKDEE